MTVYSNKGILDVIEKVTDETAKMEFLSKTVKDSGKAAKDSTKSFTDYNNSLYYNETKDNITTNYYHVCQDNGVASEINFVENNFTEPIENAKESCVTFISEILKNNELLKAAYEELADYIASLPKEVQQEEINRHLDILGNKNVDLTTPNGEKLELKYDPKSKLVYVYKNGQLVGISPSAGAEYSDIDYTTLKKIVAANNWAIGICNDDSHGYGHDFNNETVEGDISCSGVVGLAITNSGSGTSFLTDNGNWPYIGISDKFRDRLNDAGYQRHDYTSPSDLEPGDVIILNDGTHTALYLGDGKIAQANHDYDSRPGDSSGKEVRVQDMYDDRWGSVYRIPNKKN